MRGDPKTAQAAHARKYRGTGMVGEIIKLLQGSEGMSAVAIADALDHAYPRGSLIKTVHRLKGDGRLIADGTRYTVPTAPVVIPNAYKILHAMQAHARSMQS